MILFSEQAWSILLRQIRRPFPAWSILLRQIRYPFLAWSILLRQIRQTSQPDQSCSGKSGDQANKENLWEVYFALLMLPPPPLHLLYLTYLTYDKKYPFSTKKSIFLKKYPFSIKKSILVKKYIAQKGLWMGLKQVCYSKNVLLLITKYFIKTY